MINAKMVSSWTMAGALQQAGHDVYWFENGWYHSLDCPACLERRPTLLAADDLESPFEKLIQPDCDMPGDGYP
jgi:hypothetical protein